MGTAMKVAVAAHLATRKVESVVAIAVARAAAHAVAISHFADHCLAASTYALKATATAGGDPQLELHWQVSQISVIYAKWLPMDCLFVWRVRP